MKVWAVLEAADYTTEALFATEELAQRYLERRQSEHEEVLRKAGFGSHGNAWAIEEFEVRTDPEVK